MLSEFLSGYTHNAWCRGSRVINTFDYLFDYLKKLSCFMLSYFTLRYVMSEKTA
jgi:hypothetical protein